MPIHFLCYRRFRNYQQVLYSLDDLHKLPVRDSVQSTCLLQIAVHVLAGVLLQTLVREGGETGLCTAYQPPKHLLFDAGLTGTDDESIPKTLFGGIFCCLVFRHML